MRPPYLITMFHKNNLVKTIWMLHKNYLLKTWLYESQCKPFNGAKICINFYWLSLMRACHRQLIKIAAPSYGDLQQQYNIRIGGLLQNWFRPILLALFSFAWKSLLIQREASIKFNTFRITIGVSECKLIWGASHKRTIFDRSFPSFRFWSSKI